MTVFIELFVRFFFIGLFAVGGGLATLPFLSDMAEATGWFTQLDISNMVAISESTPGPLGVNMATYVGYSVGSDFGMAGGFLGAVIAPMGLVVPSFIVIMIVSKILMKFRQSKYVEYIFYGLRAASVGLITAACLSVARLAFFTENTIAEGGNIFALFDYKSIILSALIFFLITKFKKLHPILLIAIAAAVGIIFKF